MDKDRVKGAVNDAAGRVKRQVGEWTGDENAQVEGTIQQATGKAQKAWGNVKDAARDAKRDLEQAKENETEHKSSGEHAHEAEHVHEGHGH